MHIGETLLGPRIARLDSSHTVTITHGSAWHGQVEMESAVVVAAVPPPATPTYLYSRESASRSDMLSRVSRGSRGSRISRGLVTVTGASCWGLQELSAVCCCCSKQKVCEVR